VVGWKSRDSVPQLVNDYLAGHLKVDEFVTHSLPMSKINDAFDLMHHGQRQACIQLHSFYLMSLMNVLRYVHIHESRFPFTRCLSLVQASPARVERSRSLVQAHNSTCVY